MGSCLFTLFEKELTPAIVNNVLISKELELLFKLSLNNLAAIYQAGFNSIRLFNIKHAIIQLKLLKNLE